MSTPRMERWIHSAEPMAAPDYHEMLDWLRWQVELLEKDVGKSCRAGIELHVGEIIEGLKLYEAMRHGGAVDGASGEDQSSPANKSGRSLDGGGVLGLSPVGDAASVYQMAADCRGV